MKLLSRPFAPCAALLALALIPFFPARAADSPPIQESTIRRTVEALAGEDFLGREAGSEGGRKAGDWLAAQLQAAGLEPAGDSGTFFQDFKAGKKSLRNVVATLPAREGSAHADETVVVGSHYDHLGKGGHGALDLTGRTQVHYGADDNASGSAGNLTLARAFALAGPSERRIVFIWFDGEELGLFGSKHYAEHPIFPLAKTIAMLNMDMIGRLRKDKLTVYGSNTAEPFAAICAQANDGLSLRLDLRDTMPPNSDHQSFYEKKVPVIALFTGLHGDYHRATDTKDKVDAAGMERVLRFAYEALRRIVDLEAAPAWKRAKDGQAEAMIEQIQAMLPEADLEKLFGGEDGLWKTFKDGGLPKVMEKLRGTGLFGGGGGRPRFGVSTTPTDDGLKVERVTTGSVAEKAGVKVGDVIQRFAGEELPDQEALVAAVRAAKGKVAVAVLRGGEKLELSADFGDGKPAEPRPSEPRPAAPTKRWF